MFSVIAILIGYLFSIAGYEYPLGIHIVPLGLVFYLLGNVTREKSIIEKLIKTKSRAILYICIFVIINIVFSLVLNVRISMYHNVLGNYVYFLISALSGILYMLILVRILPIPKILICYGQNSIVILGTHYFIKNGYILIDKLFFNSQVTTKSSFMISMILTLIMLVLYLPLISLYLKFHTKQLYFRSKVDA